MSIVTTPEAPDESESCVLSEEDIPPDQLGKYSVADEIFLWSAARELEQRCKRHQLTVPSNVASLLRLHHDAQNARSMVNALLAIDDLQKRRAVLCQMVHEIVRLK